MTAPVVRIYKSTDAGAPSVAGQAGSLIALLDAILINGYNSKTVTITRSGSVATANCTTHGFLSNQVIRHSGAGQSEYNIDAIITVIDANNYSFAVSGTPATPATGTITAKNAPADWTKDFSGTNLAAYRPPTGNRFMLRIDDTGTTQARMVGYESMSDVNTGTAAFPTAAQFSGGLWIQKSTSADSTARSWVAACTGKHLFLLIQGNTTLDYVHAYYFGDIKPANAGDAFATLIIGDAQSGNIGGQFSYVIVNSGGSAIPGHYMTRSYAQTGGSVAVKKGIDAFKSNSTTAMGNAGLSYPNPSDSGLYISPVWIYDGSIRGVLPGIWCPCHAQPLNDRDTFAGSGSFANKKFLVLRLQYGPTVGAEMFLETSDTWDI